MDPVVRHVIGNRDQGHRQTWSLRSHTQPTTIIEGGGGANKSSLEDGAFICLYCMYSSQSLRQTHIDNCQFSVDPVAEKGG